MLTYEVKVNKLQNPTGKLLGFAEVILDGWMVVKNFKIFQGSNGLFVGAPSHLGKDKEGKDTYFPDVSFLEEKNEDEKAGPRERELYNKILEAFSTPKRGESAKAQDKDLKKDPMRNKPRWT